MPSPQPVTKSAGTLVSPFAAPIVPIPVPNREEGFGIPVYWAGDHVHTERVDGIRYFFEPQAVTTIYGSFKHQVDEKGKALLDRELEIRSAPDQVVKALISKAAVKGLMVVTGTVKDEAKKVEARRMYEAWRIDECNRIIAAHETACAMAAERKAMIPRPTAAWRLAKHDLERLSNKTEDRKRFLVVKDGMDFDTMGQATAYVLRAYPGTEPKTVIKDNRPNDPMPKEEEGVADVIAADPFAVETLPVEPTKAAPAVKESAARAKADAVLLRAMKERVVLPSDVQEALLSEDEEIVELALAEAIRIIDGPTEG